MRSNNTIVILLALIASLVGCEAPRNAASSPPGRNMTLTAFAKVRLKDRDTVFIGKPNALAVSQRGEYFVTDIPSRRVLRFDASGSFMETIGRRGGGPNEFEGPAWLTPIDDTTLVIADLLRRRAVLWHLASKTVTAYLPLPGLVSPLVYVDRTLYTAAPDVEHGTAGIRWRPGAGEPERLGQVLDVYRDLFWAIWGEPALAVAGDSILYFGGRSEYVIIADRDWQPRDSLPIPRTARRGIPREIDYTVGEGRNIYDVGKQLSQPFGLRILSGGRLAVFHLDASVVNNSLVVGRVFMTVIPRAKAPRCIDVQVPAHDSTSIPRLSFLADTLFVLDHFVDGDSVVAEVSKYHIGPDLC